VNIGVGGIDSSALQKIKKMLTAGFSMGTDRERLEGKYCYVTENEDASGTKAVLVIRF